MTNFLCLHIYCIMKTMMQSLKLGDFLCFITFYFWQVNEWKLMKK